MPDTPNYRFNRRPRFSANQLADYLAASNADQRERIIRSAKFPKKIPVVAYSSARRIISDFMAHYIDNLPYLEDQVRRLETRRRREPEGWMRDELRRCIEAVAAFRRVFSRRRLRRYQFLQGPIDLSMRRNGVLINTRLDVSVSETIADGTMYSGGCVFFLASTDAARRNIEQRRNSVAARWDRVVPPGDYDGPNWR